MTTDALVPAAAEPAIATGGAGEIVLPQVIVDAGPAAVARFLEFFAGRIANARTRAAFGRAVAQFLGWCEVRGLGLRDVSPLHVAAYIRTHPGSVPTVKLHLAAIRMLGDWLVVSQVLPVNPAPAVRGPKHVVTKGATPVLSPAETRKLLESIDTNALAGLRDRALLSVMLYSFPEDAAATAPATLTSRVRVGVCAMKHLLVWMAVKQGEERDDRRDGERDLAESLSDSAVSSGRACSAETQARDARSPGSRTRRPAPLLGRVAERPSPEGGAAPRRDGRKPI